jgi:uncharacterized membrane-anchored protein
MHSLLSLIASWAEFYGNHQLASIFVRFIHLTAIVLGGGAALLIDFQVIRASRAGIEQKEKVFRYLKGIHRYVVAWLSVLIVTGVLMTAADYSVLLRSRVYWVKMALIAVLMLNGVTLLFAERNAEKLGVSSGWRRLTTASMLSVVLWQTTLFAGAFLTVAA